MALIVAALVAWMLVTLIESTFSLLVAAVLFGGAVWYGHVMALRQAEAQRRWHDIQHVRGLSGFAFERHVAELYEKLGYRTRITRGGGDQGADVIAEDGRERLAIQCKQWTDTVGNNAVQEAHAGKAFYGCDRAVVVCTTSFTSAARELAERAKVTLIDGEDYASLMARVHPTAPEVRVIHGVRIPSGKILAYEVMMMAAAFVLVIAHFSTVPTPPTSIPVVRESGTPGSVAPGPPATGAIQRASQPPVARTTPQPTVASPSRVGGNQGASAPLELSLPVEILQTSQALTQTLRYPALVHVRVPAQWSRLLSAYGVGGVVLIGPRAWTGEGSMGVDGSASATLHPQAGSPVPAGLLSYTGIPVCYGCALDESARYFSWARESWTSLSPAPGLPVPPVRPVLREVSLAHALLAYQGPYTGDGLEVNGVAFSVVDQQKNGTQTCISDCLLFAVEEIALPSSQHSLASAILNAFISHNIPKP